MKALLDPGFLRELEVLRRQLDLRVRSGRAGERVARRRGASVEFEDHRPYAPGDDLRRIDWAAYARSGEPVLKQFRADEDVVVRLLCDASASMRFGTPPKLETAKRIAAAVGYMALAGGERVQLVAARDEAEAWRSPSRGRSGLASFLRGLEAVDADGGTDLSGAIERVVMRSPRPGMLVVLSDFFDPGPVTRTLGRASSAGHDVALVQVLAREELAPELDGDVAIVDAETGQSIDVTVDASALEAYERRLASLFDALRAHARRFGASYVRTRVDGSLEAVVRDLVAKEVA
ncbi:MAG: DUF58 domain-containing protein [Polyangiaceae bacterium]|nr:DUF58 domain-containing protein [Polyangiaceae bacterium]